MSLFAAPEQVTHRTGVDWFEVPPPRRFLHRHRWETKAWITLSNGEGGFWMYRCACGATSYSDIPGWIEEQKPRFR